MKGVRFWSWQESFGGGPGSAGAADATMEFQRHGSEEDGVGVLAGVEGVFREDGDVVAFHGLRRRVLEAIIVGRV